MRSFRLLTALLQVLAIVSTTKSYVFQVVVTKSCFLFFSLCAIDGDTTCIQGAIASCVNGQFDTSQGRCPPTQQCFALPSVNTDGTVSQSPNNYFSKKKSKGKCIYYSPLIDYNLHQ
jgi:hypothetical protein